MAAVKSVLFCLLALATSGVKSDACGDKLADCRDKGIGSGPDQCGNFATWINCVSNADEICTLEENNGVTFQSLQKVAKNSCAALATVMSGDQPCQQLVQCLTDKTAYVSLVMQSNDKYLNDTVKTEFWCSMIKGGLDCALTNKDECSFEENKVNNMKNQRDKVSEVCRGCGLQGQLGVMVLALFLASLLHQVISG